MKSKQIIQGLVLAAVLAQAASACAAGAEAGASAQEFTVRTWGKAEGLPGDSVTTLLQTSDRYLWVGTSAGLARFDGVKFTLVPLPTPTSNTPPHVTALCEDAAGALWVGTAQEGLIRLDAAGTSFFRRAQGLLHDNVTSLASDSEGRLWIGTPAGLNHWDGRQFIAYTRREGLLDETVSGVHFARSGVLWITTRSGMCQFKSGRIVPFEFQTDSQGRSPEFLGAYEDRRGNLWAFGDTYLINLTEGKRFNYFRGAEAASVRIWSLCEGRDGRLWIGTSGRGLFCFDENRFQPVTSAELSMPNGVRAIYEDREGSLWLGTPGGGLVQLVPQPVRVLRAGPGLPAGGVRCLAAHPSGRLFVSMEMGGLFGGEEGRFDRVSGSKDLEGQGLVSSLCAASDGTLWIGTLGSGLHAVKGGRHMQTTTLNGLSDDFVLAVCATADGAVWAGTRAGIVHRVTAESMTTFGRGQGLPGGPVTCLLPAQAGGLWVGTEDGLLLWGGPEAPDSEKRTNPSAGVSGPTVFKFSVVHGSESGADRSILALHEDAQGLLWVGTSGAGLACWNGRRWASWDTRSGLPDDTVYGVISDAAGEMWFAMPAGLGRVSRRSIQEALARGTPLTCKLMFEIRASSRGGSAGFGGPRVVRAADGTLWFATAEGVLNVDTHKSVSENLPSPPVHIETVRVNDRVVFPTTSHAPIKSARQGGAVLRVSPDLRTMDFQFTALSFIAPEKLRFRHRLEGFDLDWVNDGGARHVRYGHLPYGQYRFRVAASLPGGAWMEAAESFAFLVPTPLWRTPAAIVLYVLSAAGLIAGVVRFVSHRRLRRRLERLEQQQALERERMRIAQDMHDEIGSKLTKISFLSERARVESADAGPVGQQIAAISNTSRELLQTLDEIVWAVNPHNDTLEHLAAYFSQYANEYFQNTAVECDLRLPRNIPHHPLSAETRHNLFLAFEEALNNVLKHSGATQARIVMAVQPTTFEINIADNGRGFDSAARRAEPAQPKKGRGGNGLVNMRQRLTQVGGQCQIQSQPGQGTTVSLRIPLNEVPSTEL